MSPAKHANSAATTKQVAQTKNTHAENAKEPDSTESQFQIIIEQGSVNKLSPKSTGKIYFQLARHQDDQTNYLRITGNDGGGLHSREWIALDKVITTLSGPAGHPFHVWLRSYAQGISSCSNRLKKVYFSMYWLMTLNSKQRHFRNALSSHSLRIQQP